MERFLYVVGIVLGNVNGMEIRGNGVSIVKNRMEFFKEIIVFIVFGIGNIVIVIIIGGIY